MQAIEECTLQPQEHNAFDPYPQFEESLFPCSYVQEENYIMLFSHHQYAMRLLDWAQTVLERLSSYNFIMDCKCKVNLGFRVHFFVMLGNPPAGSNGG